MGNYRNNYLLGSVGDFSATTAPVTINNMLAASIPTRLMVRTSDDTPAASLSSSATGAHTNRHAPDRTSHAETGTRLDRPSS